jgi:predicted RNA binding protein YcfA (HicA-like mRNA interferase family)
LGELKTLSASAVRKILADHGFVEVRQRGSHVIMQRRVEGTTFTVPVPNHREIAIGTLQSIVRQSGLPRALFEQ